MVLMRTFSKLIGRARQACGAGSCQVPKVQSTPIAAALTPS
jgi:hypothetical protein